MIRTEKRVFPGTGKTLIVFNFEGDAEKNKHFIKLDAKLKGKLKKAAAQHLFSGKQNQHITVEGDGLYEHVLVYGLGKQQEVTPAVFRECLAGAVRVASSLRTSSVGFFYPQELEKNYAEGGKELALGFYLAEYRFETYKGKEELKKRHTIRDLYVYTEEKVPTVLEEGIATGEKIAKGVMLTRNLVNEPGSKVHPDRLVDEAFRIAKESKGTVSVEVLDERECREAGMGAFLGVAQGSERKPQFIILTYKGNAKAGKKICLVGKSITFDSGGLSLKPSKAMEDMKIDMAGGASVLGVFQALADGVPVPHEVIGILPACENMPSGRAMRPGDVVTALNGKTIEVLNTDAEGRLALADAISYAEKLLKPDLIIDFATLTGACMVALGEDIAGVFGNNEKEVERFLEITKKEEESAWELPFYKPYLELLKSDIADIKNVAAKGYGGAITAALFVGEFVARTKWIHVDIAGPAHNAGKVQGTRGKGGTGWGVISIINLLQSA